MFIELASVFSTATKYLPVFHQQVTSLQDALTSDGHELHLILVEGDSRDNTWDELHRLFPSADIIKRAHGGPRYGSVVNTDRFRQLSYVGNGVFERVSGDVLVYVESDLLWDANTIRLLISRLERVPAVVPMVFYEDNAFYDVWAFRKDGVRFNHHPPYHTAIHSGELAQLDSAGSCMVMRGEMAKVVSFPPEDCFVGLCRLAYENGFSIWLDPTLRVTHPFHDKQR